MNSNSSDPYIISVWLSVLRVGNGGAEGGGGTFKNLFYLWCFIYLN